MGVSTALVSYVLNNKEKEARVGKEIAKKIRKVAADMNYQPNLIARSLKNGKTNTIGLIVADISNPFFSAIARIIEDEAAKHSYTVIIGSSDEDEIKSKAVGETMISRQVDGLILAPTENDFSFINNLAKRKIPFVLIDRDFPSLKTNSVTINNFEAAYEAVTHLISRGYRKIGFVTYKSKLNNINERKRGYIQALADNGLEVKDSHIANIRYQHIKEDVRNKLTELTKTSHNVDAFFFATNSLAVESLHLINSIGLSVPQEIGIISFDESDAFDFFYAPLTFVKQNLQEIGSHAVRILLNSIENIENIESIKVNSELIIRKSSVLK